VWGYQDGSLFTASWARGRREADTSFDAVDEPAGYLSETQIEPEASAEQDLPVFTAWGRDYSG